MRTASMMALAIATFFSTSPTGILAQPASGIVADPSYDGSRQQRYEQHYVTANVNLRAGPGTRYQVLGTLRRGDFVNVAGCSNGWCEVNAGNRPDGYVSARYIGRGENPYNSRGPLGPSIPRQEPGTRSNGQQTYGNDMLPAPGGGGVRQQSYGNDMLPSAEVEAFQRIQDRLEYRDARIAWSDGNCAVYRAIDPSNALYEEPLRTASGQRICRR